MPAGANSLRAMHEFRAAVESRDLTPLAQAMAERLGVAS
jgi:hypothetical protein